MNNESKKTPNNQKKELFPTARLMYGNVPFTAIRTDVVQELHTMLITDSDTMCTSIDIISINNKL